MSKSYRLIIAATLLIILVSMEGCSTMSVPFNLSTERPVVEDVIKNSIRWVLTKDTAMLYNCFAQDSTLFWFSPDNAGTISGFDSFRKLTEQLFMDPRFKGVSSEFRTLQIHFSRSGECAWWSCYLDDFNEWDGRPSNWVNVRWTGVLEKLGGEWKIRQMHFSHALEDFKK
jgi:hypothetical protein